MTTSKRLIELYVSGASAKYLVDALLEELPSPSVIRQTVLRDLPGSKVTIENDVVYIECDDRQAVIRSLPILECMYPELDFVHTNK